MTSTEKSGISKQFLKSRPMCKVTFLLPKEAVPSAQQVFVVGDFNGWNEAATPLTRRKSGDFAVVVELPVGKEYRFRYCIDCVRWENDRQADRYVPNIYGGEDSLVVI